MILAGGIYHRVIRVVRIVNSKQGAKVVFIGLALLISMVAMAQSASNRVATLIPVIQMLLNDSNADASDRDGDGVPDHLDAFPDDPDEQADSDGDGIGDNADPDPNDPRSLVIVNLEQSGDALLIEWISAYSSDCRVLYGLPGQRPDEGVSATSDYRTPSISSSGLYRVLVECYDEFGNSEFSRPATMEVL